MTQSGAGRTGYEMVSCKRRSVKRILKKFWQYRSFQTYRTVVASDLSQDSPATSGLVTFLSGGLSVATGSVNGSGVATAQLSSLSVGANSITASYGGSSNLAPSVSTAVVVTVAPETTTITLGSSTLNSSYGGAVTFTATVSANNSQVTSGVVTFLSGGLPVATGSVNNGVATLNLTTLSIGANSITASFGGTSNLAASASNAVTVTVSPDTTTTTLIASAMSPSFGATVTLTATVGGNGVPATSGVVSFLSNGSSVGTGTVNGSGVATVSLSTLPTGSDAITATFGGTSNLAASASDAVTVTVAPDTTTTTLSASTLSPSYGASVTLTATVSVGGSPATSGVVTFLSGGIPVATGSVNSGGVATINSASLPVGAETISASYGGTSNLAPSTSNAVLVTVGLGVTTTVLHSSSSNLAYGSSATLTGTVAEADNLVMIGTMMFFNNGQPIGAATIYNGVGTISLTTLPVGSNSITVSFTGTSNFAASTSSVVMVTLSPDQTSTTLSASTTNPAFGSSVILTAAVANGSSPATNGIVTFLSGGTSIGTGVVINGVATLNLTTLPIGVNSITASFAGTLTLAPSTSAAVAVSVSLDATTTILSTSTANPAFGSSVILTAAVANGSSPASSGTVTFLDGGLSIGTGTVINGVATLNLTTLPIGANSITASFAGTLTLAPSTSAAVAVSVSLDATTTILSMSTANPAFGSSVILTAAVANGSSPATNGIVTFLSGGTSIGTGVVINGVATLNLTTLPIGANSITASFAGTLTLAPSAAVAVSVSLDATTTILSTSTANPAFGSSVILTAAVANGSSPASSGTVTFLDGVERAVVSPAAIWVEAGRNSWRPGLFRVT